MEKNKYYRLIPKVDILMDRTEIKKICTGIKREYVLESVRKEYAQGRRRREGKRLKGAGWLCAVKCRGSIVKDEK